jgi:hypothetical protein
MSWEANRSGELDDRVAKSEKLVEKLFEFEACFNVLMCKALGVQRGLTHATLSCVR